MRSIRYLLRHYKSFGVHLSKPWLGCWPSLSQPSMAKKENMVETSNWNKLPKDIQRLIFERLDLVSQLRFNLVCKGWKTNTTRTPRLLWLMLPPDEKYCRRLSFFDAANGKVHKLSVPKSAQGGWFLGASNGWLFMAYRSGDDPKIFLFDPISRVQVPLPPLSTISDFEYSFAAQRSKWNAAACIIAQVVVSSSDASQCIVAARIIDDMRILALCKPGDERWTVVGGLIPDEDDEYIYLDLLFSDDGKTLNVCVIKQGFGAFRTHPITLSGGHELNLKLIPCIFPHLDQQPLLGSDADGITWYFKDIYFCPYLVESNGQMLMVIRISEYIRHGALPEVNDEDYFSDEEEDFSDEEEDFSNEEEDFSDEEEDFSDDEVGLENLSDVEGFDESVLLAYYSTVEFQLWKIEASSSNGDTMSVTRLSSVGDQSLFVGGVSNQERNSKVWDKNCIYFIEDNDFSYENEYPLSRDSGAFYLHDGSIKRSFPSIKTDNECYCGWFSPNIKVGSFD